VRADPDGSVASAAVSPAGASGHSHGTSNSNTTKAIAVSGIPALTKSLKR
jgi:hypothetical protein